MLFDPLCQYRCNLVIWIGLFLDSFEGGNVLILVFVAVTDRTAFGDEVLKYDCVVSFSLLQPESKPEPTFGSHPPIRVCLRHRTTVQQKRAPGTVPARRGLRRPATVSLVEFSLSGPFAVGQFFQPGQIRSRVLDRARSSVGHKCRLEFHPCQSRV